MTRGADKNVYSFDTSGLIDGLERFYPETNFPRLWERIDELIDDGRLLVAEEAWREACGHESATQVWCQTNSRARCVYPTSLAIAQLSGAIVTQFPTWLKQGTKNYADPFVIAVAQATGGIVVSGEKHGGPGTPKMPYVCQQINVAHWTLTDVIRAEGWVFG